MVPMEMNTTADSTSVIGSVRITPSNHGANSIRKHLYVANPEQLMQQVSLGKKLRDWELRVQDKQFYAKLHEQDDFDMEHYDLPTSTEEELREPHVEIFQSSLISHNTSTRSVDGDAQPLLTSKNGLVWSVMYAYSDHHHLTLRPEDLWFAILTQFSAYLNAHAEEFRHIFVAHEGRKELVIRQYSPNRYAADYRSFANNMGRLIQENILDDGFREWIMPDFSTTSSNDKVLASVLMMATMQKYFTYGLQLLCGLPSVTLLGKREDYEQILKKLGRLEGFGDEPVQFAALLKPVLLRFILSFDDPSAPEVIDFWQRSVHHFRGGSGPTKYSGWITAFCFWDKDGNCLYEVNNDANRKGHADSDVTSLELDGVQYGVIQDSQVPSGYSKVPVKIDDNGEIIMAEMTAGSVGIACSSSGRSMEDGSLGLDSMQPVSAWWISEA